MPSAQNAAVWTAMILLGLQLLGAMVYCLMFIWVGTVEKLLSGVRFTAAASGYTVEFGTYLFANYKKKWWGKL